jgi:hypothetical protein
MLEDGFDLRVAQRRIDGQRNGLEEGRFGFGIACHSEVMMKRFEDRSTISDARLSAGGEKLGDVFCPDDVTVIDMLAVRRAGRHRQEAFAKKFIVLSGEGPAAPDQGREFPELRQTQGRLQIRQLVVVAEAPITLFVVITQISNF